MKKTRINTEVVQDDWRFERSLQFRNERHADYQREGENGHFTNAEGLSVSLIGWILRDGPELARSRAQLLLPSFAPGVTCAIAFYGEEAALGLVDIGVTVLLYEALGVDCGTASFVFASYMVRVDPEEIISRYARWRWGLFSLCIDEPKAWRFVAGMLPDETLPPVVPGQTFEFNTQGLMRYLAAAMEQRVPVAHVLPAYRDYLKHYPTLRSAKEATFETLFCVAVLVHHRIGGHPITDVPALLQQDHLANVEE